MFAFFFQKRKHCISNYKVCQPNIDFVFSFNVFSNSTQKHCCRRRDGRPQPLGLHCRGRSLATWRTEILHKPRTAQGRFIKRHRTCCSSKQTAAQTEEPLPGGLSSLLLEVQPECKAGGRMVMISLGRILEEEVLLFISLFLGLS